MNTSFFKPTIDDYFVFFTQIRYDVLKDNGLTLYEKVLCVLDALSIAVQTERGEEYTIDRELTPIQQQFIDEIVEETSEYTILHSDNRDLLMAFHSIILSALVEYTSGQFFTDYAISNMIFEITNIKENETVLDPCMGAGSLLPFEKTDLCYGIDIDKLIIACIKFVHILLGKKYHPERFHWSQKPIGSLEEVWIKENGVVKVKPDIFSEPVSADSTQNTYIERIQNPFIFDAVFSNPPYGKTFFDLNNPHVKQTLLDNFPITSATFLKKDKPATRFDSIYPFVEQFLNFLKPDGKYAFVLPDSFGTTEYFINIRQHLIENTRLTAIINFEECSFPKVSFSVIVLIGYKYTLDEDYQIYSALIKQQGFDYYTHQGLVRKRYIPEVDEKLNVKYDEQGKIITRSDFPKVIQEYKEWYKTQPDLVSKFGD
jgi:type I restriction-modification system DNA methylase subunit